LRKAENDDIEALKKYRQ